MKICKKCGVEKPATTEYWHTHKCTKDGLHTYCKDCRSQIHKDYMNNPKAKENVLKKMKEWQEGKGKEKYLTYRYNYNHNGQRKAWQEKNNEEKIKRIVEMVVKQIIKEEFKK